VSVLRLLPAEAYIPQSDTYIEKDALINDGDRSHAATPQTRSLLASRRGGGGLRLLHLRIRRARDVPGDAPVAPGRESVDRDEIVRRLVAVQYERNDYDFHRGTFRVRGEVVEIFPANENRTRCAVELWGDVVEAIHRIDRSSAVLERLPECASTRPATT